jgi:hypothetical protein
LSYRKVSAANFVTMQHDAARLKWAAALKSPHPGRKAPTPRPEKDQETMRLILLPILLLASLAPASAAPATLRMEGTKAFVARPQFGAAVFNLPATVRWKSTALAGGRYRVALTADVNTASVLANIKPLSAKALDRNIPCGDMVKVQSAAAKLTGPRMMKYDLRFRYMKRVCAGGTLEFPADVACAARIAVTAARSIITIDVKGATNPPCQIAGAYDSVSGAITALVGIDVFKRHTLDLARLLPKEFQGVTIDIRALAFDMPPAPVILRIAGESTMSQAQFVALMSRLEAAAPTATN